MPMVTPAGMLCAAVPPGSHDWANENRIPRRDFTPDSIFIHKILPFFVIPSFSGNVFQPEITNLGGTMDSMDVAFGKEGDGKGYYLRCGAEAGIPGLSRIFDMFSEDEGRHADALRALQGGARVELSHSATLDGARSILRRLSVEEAALSSFNGDLGCYGSAMDFEAANVRLCGQLAREAGAGWERELFLKIAAEDEIHFTLLEHMCDLLKTALPAGAGRAGATDAN